MGERDEMHMMEEASRLGEQYREIAYEGIIYEERILEALKWKTAEQVNLGWLEEVIDEGLAYQMGRLTERYGYTLSSDGPAAWELTRLTRLFCTVEEARDRPITKIAAAVTRATLENLDRLGRDEIAGFDGDEAGEEDGEKSGLQWYDVLAVSEAERDNPKYDGWRSLTAKEAFRFKLYELHARATAILNITTVDQQVMLAADDAQAMVDLVLRQKDLHFLDTITPDSMVWKAAFSGEWGEKVDRALWLIDVVGREGFRYVDENKESRHLKKPFADSKEFSDERVFANFMKRLYKAAGRDMSAALFAWQLARGVWGIIGEYGYTVKEEEKNVWNHKGEHLGKKKVKVHKIGDSPFVTNHQTWTMHTGAKRAAEWGITCYDQVAHPRGEEFPFLTTYRFALGGSFVSHAGLPYSLGITKDKELLQLLPSYLKSAKIDYEGKKVSLYDLWSGEITGKRIPLGKLPWGETQRVETGTDESLPLASFGLWRSLHSRALAVVTKLLRGNPPLRDLTSEEFWQGSVFRHLAKVTPINNIPGDSEYTKPSESFRTRLVLSWILARRPSLSTDKGLLVFHYVHPDEQWKGVNADDSPVSVARILWHAVNTSFLRDKDFDWIMEQVKEVVTLTHGEKAAFYKKS